MYDNLSEEISISRKNESIVKTHGAIKVDIGLAGYYFPFRDDPSASEMCNALNMSREGFLRVGAVSRREIRLFWIKRTDGNQRGIAPTQRGSFFHGLSSHFSTGCSLMHAALHTKVEMANKAAASLRDIRGTNARLIM